VRDVRDVHACDRWRSYYRRLPGARSARPRVGAGRPPASRVDSPPGPAPPASRVDSPPGPAGRRPHALPPLLARARGGRGV